MAIFKLPPAPVKNHTNKKQETMHLKKRMKQNETKIKFIFRKKKNL